jgi:hypothetical protein
MYRTLDRATRKGERQKYQKVVVLQKGQPNVTQTLPTCPRIPQKNEGRKVKPEIWFVWRMGV